MDANELIGSESEVRGSLKMIRRAIRQGWITPYTAPPELFSELPERLMQITRGDDTRAAIGAARTLVAMQDHNLAICRALDDGVAPMVQVNVGHDIEVKLIDANGDRKTL